MFIVFFGSVVLKDTPLNAVQMLWVNLIMDTFAALALATEPPADDIVSRKPYPKDAAIATDVMWRNILGHAYYQIAVLMVVVFAGEGWLVQEYSRSCIQKSATQTHEVDGVQVPVCETYNPFYSHQVLYTDASYTGWWSKQFSAGAVSKFDADRYAQWNCQANIADETGDVSTDPFECTKENPSASFTNQFPQTQPDGQPT
jgi:hypothetical protein